MPPIVIGAGWFCCCATVVDVFAVAPIMVVAVNAVMAMPFAIRAVRPAYDAASERHERLCLLLGISGWTRFRLVDWPSLRRPLGTAFAFAMALSLGDLGVIALFGSDSVQTLPYLLLARMGSYRTADAAGLALLLGLRLSGTCAGRGPVGAGRKTMTLTNLEKGAGAQGGAAVRLGKVHFSYGEAPFVFDVEFAVSKITAIMGPSGSGKSTLLNLVAGFETPQSGRVLIDGADMTARPPPARPVSMVFQENNLFAHLSVERNVGLGRSPSLSLSEADRGAIAEALGASALPARKSVCRANCRAANGSAWRSPAFWCATGRCFCSTSLSPRSGRRCATTCSIW